MNLVERLIRKIEVLVFKRKYCSMTSRHGHALIHEYSKGKGMDRFMVWRCSVCKDRFIYDAVGLTKA